MNQFPSLRKIDQVHSVHANSWLKRLCVAACLSGVSASRGSVLAGTFIMQRLWVYVQCMVWH
jgi:hypothetical protein